MASVHPPGRRYGYSAGRLVGERGGCWMGTFAKPLADLGSVWAHLQPRSG